jgi:hypothetical protein
MCLPKFKHKPGRFKRTGRRKRLAPKPGPHQPRTRKCLLKGCERWFRPRRASELYCSSKCRQEARRWSRWKAQLKYRATLAGREKRKGQSRRYRERVRNRSQAEPEESPPGARGSSLEIYLITVATAPAAMPDSRDSPDPPPSGSVRTRVGAPWSGSGSASGAGASLSSNSGSGEKPAQQISLSY